MRTSLIRLMLTLTAFVLVLQWSRPSSADTFSGTVGEIGIGTDRGDKVIRFKFTNVNTLAACPDPNVNAANVVGVAGYAWFYDGGNNQDTMYKEWYAALLVSKKGAPISCIVLPANNAQGCHVTSCTLP